MHILHDSFARLKVNYTDINTAQGLENLNAAFVQYIAEQHPDLSAPVSDLLAADMSSMQHSNLALSIAPALDEFLQKIFAVEHGCGLLSDDAEQNQLIFKYKNSVVIRDARRRLRVVDANPLPEFAQLSEQLNSHIDLTVNDPELAIAELYFSANSGANKAVLDLIIDWTASALSSASGQKFVADWQSFKLPARINEQELLDVDHSDSNPSAMSAPQKNYSLRSGFDLQDAGASAREAGSEMHYCILCQQRDNDTCSKGFPLKKQRYNDGFKSNGLGVELSGCPLKQKISEMNELKRAGYSLAALAIAMVDNPLIALTGHRICNDCMQSCIYQKQEPVDVPKAESRILRDVLNLDYGVEIYSLLMRWNPLRMGKPAMLAYNGYKTAIAGAGPAGIAMAHQMLQAGYLVALTDGLKIEALDFDPAQAVKSFNSLCSKLSERQVLGFGGVAEYGITVRWDKNFLNLVLLCLLRYENFAVQGSVRFGGNLTVQSARELGFDHLCLAIGAGLPQAINIQNSLAPGVRMSSEFLMTLHLMSAHKQNSLSDLQIELPLIVIGGGLSAVDAATEAQAFYIAMIEKVYFIYSEMDDISKNKLEDKLSKQDWNRLQKFYQHGAMWHQEKQQAEKESRPADNIALLHAWGGVTIIYRRRVQDSPAYRDYAAEIQSALDQGVRYIEMLQPVKACLDENGELNAVKFLQAETKDGSWSLGTEEFRVDAKTMLLATGSQPNIAYEYEHRGTFNRDGAYYKGYSAQDFATPAIDQADAEPDGALTSQVCDKMHVSFIGDLHPKYAGSVVRAIASAKDKFADIDAAIQARDSFNNIGAGEFLDNIAERFSSKVISCVKLDDTLYRLKIKSIAAAQSHECGQFYRVQTTCEAQQTSALALEAEVDKQTGTLSFIVDSNTLAGKIISELNIGDAISIMGPTGCKDNPSSDSILVVGGIAAQVALLARRQYWQDKKIAFICIAGNSYLNKELSEYVESIYNCSHKDFISDTANCIANIADAQLYETVYAFGAPDIVGAIKSARDKFAKTAQFKALVSGRMQCMLKGVCADCLQWQIDPITGKRTKAVYACSWQIQPMDIVDWSHAEQKTKQNRLMAELINQFDLIK